MLKQLSVLFPKKLHHGSYFQVFKLGLNCSFKVCFRTLKCVYGGPEINQQWWSWALTEMLQQVLYRAILPSVENTHNYLQYLILKQLRNVAYRDVVCLLHVQQGIQEDVPDSFQHFQTKSDQIWLIWKISMSSKCPPMDITDSLEVVLHEN